jgi:peptide/nickel transport system permease protein
MTIAIISGLKLGKIAGGNKNSKKDISIRILSYFFVSIPAFVVIIFVWQVNINTPFNIFPMGGYKSSEFSDPPVITYIPLLDCLISGRIYLFADYLWHLVVPVSAMTVVQLVIIMRQTRASMIDTMEKDYIRTVQAKGFSKRYIINKHAFKNAAPSGIIASGLGFTIILGGMIAVEKIYQLPGLGYLFLRSIEWSDYPVIIATVFIFSIVAISFNFISDLVIALIDPRIKIK